jgi:hypothetical protein
LDNRDLLSPLERLIENLGSDPGDLHANLAALSAALDRAVSGSTGLQLTVVHSGHPVTLTATVAERVEATTTSLRLPLPLLSPVYEPGGRAVFYSSVQGTFVDLAADLTYVLDRARTHPVTIELDGDLPLMTSGVLVTGLDDLATLNRAAGILIAQGQHPDTAPQALRSRAAAAGLTPLAYARQLLGR